MNDRDRLLLADILVRSTLYTLAAHGVDAGQVEGQDSAPEGFVLAFVDFTGEKLRGTLRLDPSRALLERSYPATDPGVATHDNDLYDWSGELSNLLLGRLKRELGEAGVVIQLSTPVVVSGNALPTRASSHPTVCVTGLFASEAGAMRVRLDVTAEPLFRLGTLRPPPAPAPDLGVDAFMFD